MTKSLKDYRDDLVVIVAGYTEPMQKFFNSNQGLKSQFNTFIEFTDYEINELEKMLILICDNNDYSLDNDVHNLIRGFLEGVFLKKEDNFANGRLVRNLYDKLVMNHARKVVNIENPTKDDLSIIKVLILNFCNIKLTIYLEIFLAENSSFTPKTTFILLIK